MMGYAYYDTPLGPAGYSVEDVCHEPDCAIEIDRGLGYLCGDNPGCEDEFGCGRWYCEKHLYSGLPEGFQIIGGGLCARCADLWEQNNPIGH